MLTLTGEHSAHDKTCRILGIDFFPGTLEGSIAAMRDGGLLVAPSAPGLLNLRTNSGYGKALQNADVCLADSSFMVMIWNWILGGRISRISGLTYMRRLLEEPELQNPGNTFWVMVSQESADRNLEWLAKRNIVVTPENVYVAPIYGEVIRDPALVERLRALHPKHIIVTLGGGTQEPLGFHLKQNLDYRPAIYCTGAAIAFLSGDQIGIPVWVDRCYLGWLWRCRSNPWLYVKRYWNALKLLPLLLVCGSQLPPPSK